MVRDFKRSVKNLVILFILTSYVLGVANHPFINLLLGPSTRKPINYKNIKKKIDWIKSIHLILWTSKDPSVIHQNSMDSPINS